MPSFADDFTLYCAKKSPHEAGRAVSDTLGNVADALEMKGLSLSPEKTVAMFITHRSTTDIPAVTCNCTPIKTVTQARLLGVIVDDQLSWREHVNHLRTQELPVAVYLGLRKKMPCACTGLLGGRGL